MRNGLLYMVDRVRVDLTRSPTLSALPNWDLILRGYLMAQLGRRAGVRFAVASKLKGLNRLHAFR